MRSSRVLADNVLGYIATRDLIVMRRCNNWLAQFQQCPATKAKKHDEAMRFIVLFVYAVALPDLLRRAESTGTAKPGTTARAAASFHALAHFH